MCRMKSSMLHRPSIKLIRGTCSCFWVAGKDIEYCQLNCVNDWKELFKWAGVGSFSMVLEVEWARKLWKAF